MSRRAYSSTSLITPDLSSDRGPGFGAYIHWPFCAAKCPYCDFNSHVANGPVDEMRYLAAYQAEIKDWAARLDQGRGSLTSVFFGGGTPSLMSPRLVEGVLLALENAFGFVPDIEISLEANPQSSDAAKFDDLAAIGVNRLSLGVQSFNDGALQRLGRLHDASQARRAIEMAAATFPRFSFDLIYARPGQSTDDWRKEMETALSYHPRHLSVYQLTIEPNTAYKRLYDAGKLIMPDDDLTADLYALTGEVLSAAGLPAYEVSNHAVPGEEARHNLVYWRYGDFLGLGPGAHGRVVINGERLATRAERVPQDWLINVELAGGFAGDFEVISEHEQAVEMLLMGLRLAEGVSQASLAVATGHRIEDGVISAARLDGLLAPSLPGDNEGWLCPSERGVALLNQLCLRLSEGLRPIGSNV